jgi:glycosyltransferase involved in cell wall biosynthesis
MNLEILIPLRNPTAVFVETIESLAAQLDKDFSVLISDNFSTSGLEEIERALTKLKEAGIAARKIQPPSELGRVEHWNWLHYQSDADWLKPLFAGDWLEYNYVALLRQTVAVCPQCHYVFVQFGYHRDGMPEEIVPNKWAGRFNSPAEMQNVVLRFGMQFGPPCAAAYERTAFFALGGYPTTLPICADSIFFCTMAARFGAAGIARRLCHFQLHKERFSIHLPGKRRDTFRETMIYIFMLAYHGWTERDAFPKTGFARLIARSIRDH